MRNFQNKVKGRCLAESCEFDFILEVPDHLGTVDNSRKITACMIQRVSAIGSHPTIANIQEKDCGGKEVYTYTSLPSQLFSVREVVEELKNFNPDLILNML